MFSPHSSPHFTNIGIVVITTLWYILKKMREVGDHLVGFHKKFLEATWQNMRLLLSSELPITSALRYIRVWLIDWYHF